MPNIAAVLKDEISRLARKEVRRQTDALRKASAQYRKDIAGMKRRLCDLQRKLTLLQSQALKDVASQATEADAQDVRFTAKGLRSHRKRLGLSAADCGKLIGVTGQTIYSWEHGTARPRRRQLAGIASLRRMGKRQAQARVGQLARAGRRKSK